MQKKSKLEVIIKGECPQCHQGKMFNYPAYDLRSFGKANTTCSVCGLHFEIEPGFFIGAMYVSYAMNVGLFLTTVFVLYFFFNDPVLWIYIASVTSLSLLAYPLIFRYSRILFLHIFGGVKYEPQEEQIPKS